VAGELFPNHGLGAERDPRQLGQGCTDGLDRFARTTRERPTLQVADTPPPASRPTSLCAVPSGTPSRRARSLTVHCCSGATK
jgi:hypothetical protein